MWSDVIVITEEELEELENVTLEDLEQEALGTFIC